MQPNGTLGEEIKCHESHDKALAHLKALEVNVVEKEAERVAFEPFKAQDWQKPIKILPLGTFYRGDRVLKIDEPRAQQIVQNFSKGLPRYGVYINVEHGDEPTQKGSIGEVKEMRYIPGDGIYATRMDFTDIGKRLLEEDRYKGVSPEMVWSLNNNAKYQDPNTGEYIDNVMTALALTTSPFFGKSVQVFSAKGAERMAFPYQEQQPPQQGQQEQQQAGTSPQEALKKIWDYLQKLFGQPQGQQPQQQPQGQMPMKASDNPIIEELSVAIQNEPIKGGTNMAEPTKPEPVISPEQFKALQDKANEVELLKAKLTAQEESSKKLAEQFAVERQLRRMGEYTKVAETFSAIPAKSDELAKNLMWLADADNEKQEHFAYFKGLLDTYQAAMKESGLFTATGSGKTEPQSDDPFLAKVKEIQAKRYADKPHSEGFSAAMRDAGDEFPELSDAFVAKAHFGR